MQRALKNEIKRLCRKRAATISRQLAQDADHAAKFQRRTGLPAGLGSPQPAPQSVHRHFDPRYCARNANFLAKTIWHKVLDRTYRPEPAVSFRVPKPTGGTREIMSFSIPDAALANLIMWRARERNLKRISPFSYAYHPDRNVFDAILALAGFIRQDRLVAVQIDFKKYFDSIPTRYLMKCVNDEDLISLTPHEKFVLREFMFHRHANRTNYTAGIFDRRVKGTPQGCSASLLLANLANHELDRALERRSGRFVRFADDVVALCSTYEEAQALEDTFEIHCASSGLEINREKSDGIAIIANKEAEIRTKAHFDYLGYRFTKDGLSMPERVRKRIIAKLSRLIQLYLIQYPEKFGFNPARVGFNPDFDWELLGLVSEIRGYLYGGLTESEVTNFLSTGARLRKMRGLMGFYALLSDQRQLKELDGWLVNQLRRALNKRHQILSSMYGAAGLRPTNTQLILGTWLHPQAWRGDRFPEVRLPSFVRGWRASRKYYYTFGLEDVEPPSYSYY